MIRTAALCLAVLLLVAGCRQGPAQAPATPPPAAPPASTPPAPGVAGPGVHRAAIGSLSLPVPRTDDLSHADPKHFAAALGNDPERIFTFVRDSIAFEAYPGLLRGPRGTLLATAGNSVDRAALLAAMLEHAGQRVRFARGMLDERHARDLVMSMWASREEVVQGPPPTVPAEIKAILDVLPSAVTRDLNLIRGKLTTLGIQPGHDAMPSLEVLVGETRQHYWVQWSKDGQWINLDPSFANAQVGQVSTTADETLSELPDALAHQVRIRVKVEEYTDAQASTREILAFSTTSAELSASDLTLIHMPENWQGPATSLTGGISEAVSSTGRLRPVLVAQTQYTRGEPFQPPVSARGIGSVGRLLGGRGAAIASAELLEIEFIDPFGNSETVSRKIYDAVGPARRAAGQKPSTEDLQKMEIADLTRGGYSLYFTTGRIDSSQLTKASPAPSPVSGDAFDLRAWLNPLHLAFVIASDSLTGHTVEPNRAHVIFYPTSPRVTILDLALQGDTTRLRLDLRHTRTRAVAAGTQPEDAVFAQIRRGVVEGTLERVLLTLWTRPAAGRTGTVFSTSTFFEAAQSQGVQMLALPSERSQMGGDIPPDALARLDADVARGYVALAPQRALSVDGTARYAWWRIRPTTGETTAVTDEGLHGAEEQPAVTAVVTRSPLGVTEAVRVYYMGVFARVLVQSWVGAAEIEAAGGIGAILALLRNQGIPRVFR